MPILAIYLGGIGLCVGSFLGLISLRLPRGEDVVFGRSRCRGCGNVLRPWHMIPIISWLIARGRCQDCRSAIPLRYPFIELGAGLIGLWAGLNSSETLIAIVTAVLGWQLLLIAIIDAEHFQLPDQLTVPLFVTGLIASVALHTDGLPHNLPELLAQPLIGAGLGFGGLWLLAKVYQRLRGRQGLGDGDPLLLAACGAWVGWMGLPSVVLIASIFGLSLALGALVTRRPINDTTRLPFGTFLAAGLWCTWLYGPFILI